MTKFDPRWDAPDFDPDTLTDAERQKFNTFWSAEVAAMAADADADGADL